MPFVQINGVFLYYQIHGRPLRLDSPPLLLIGGLGFATWSWFKQIPALTRHYPVIAFDNRGCGRSEKPQHWYDVATLAADAASLLETLDVSRAHVLGASLGGFIAQELALRYPERVAKLILCCTSFGGTRSIPMRWSTLQATLGWGAMSKTMAVRRGLEVATSSAYRDASADELAQIIEWRQSDQMGRGDYVRQVMAGMRFDAARRVHAISAPTLVIHGADDQVVPVANAPLLAQEIPNAQVRIIAGAGHLVFIERAAQVNQAIIEFLGTASPGTAAAVRDVRSAPAAAARSLPRAWQWLRAGLARPMRSLARWWRRVRRRR